MSKNTFTDITQGEILMNRETKQMYLSLYIGCRIIDALEGSMLANSMLGKGTVFKILLPCKFP